MIMTFMIIIAVSFNPAFKPLRKLAFPIHLKGIGFDKEMNEWKVDE